MNDFDQAARRVVKEDPAGQLRWLLPRLPGVIVFARWLDTQSAPRPGEPDRRCDTIAELTDATPGHPWAIVVELFTQADPDAHDRAQEYLWRFRRELRHGPHDRDRYYLGAVLVFLTNGPGSVDVEMALPGGDCVISSRLKLWRLAEEDAIATLKAIEENRVAWSILAWVSLMRGGQTREAVELWRTLAERENDIQKQRLFASFALVFSELTSSEAIRTEGLEGFAVNESAILREARLSGRKDGIAEGRKDGIAEGRKDGIAEGRRDALLRFLNSRYRATVSADLSRRIQEQKDPDVLARWFDRALAASTLEAFLASLDE